MWSSHLSRLASLLVFELVVSMLLGDILWPIRLCASAHDAAEPGHVQRREAGRSSRAAVGLAAKA